MILKFNKATTLIGIILVNMLAISCGCGETPKEKERKKRAEEEQQLAEEEKQLMNKLKNHFKPNFWDNIKYQNLKSNVSDIENQIKNSKSLLEILEKKEFGKSEMNTKLVEDYGLWIARLQGTTIPFENSISIFSSENIDKVKQAISDELPLLENLKKQLELKNKGKKIWR